MLARRQGDQPNGATHVAFHDYKITRGIGPSAKEEAAWPAGIKTQPSQMQMRLAFACTSRVTVLQVGNDPCLGDLFLQGTQVNTGMELCTLALVFTLNTNTIAINIKH